MPFQNSCGEIGRLNIDTSDTSARLNPEKYDQPIEGTIDEVSDKHGRRFIAREYGREAKRT